MLGDFKYFNWTSVNKLTIWSIKFSLCYDLITNLLKTLKYILLLLFSCIKLHICRKVVKECHFQVKFLTSVHIPRNEKESPNNVQISISYIFFEGGATYAFEYLMKITDTPSPSKYIYTKFCMKYQDTFKNAFKNPSFKVSGTEWKEGQK